jgi:hypothetical protein
MRLSHALRSAAFAGMLVSATAPAQTSETGQTPAERLEQLDETYSANLRRYHAPIIQEYLAALEKLRQTMALRSRPDGVGAVLAEIERVKKISSGSGLLPYDIPPPGDPAGPPPPPSPVGAKPPAKAGPAGAIILSAASAKKISPDPATLPEKPDGRAVPVGSAEWRIGQIAAGRYRISILYSCAGKPAASVISARLGEQRIEQTLTAENATGGINEFRIAKLGVISLEKDGTGLSLVLQNSDAASAAIWVRQVIIARPDAKEGGAE